MSIRSRIKWHVFKRVMTGPVVATSLLLVAAGLGWTAFAGPGWEMLLTAPATLGALAVGGLATFLRHLTKAKLFRREATTNIRRTLEGDDPKALSRAEELLSITREKPLLDVARQLTSEAQRLERAKSDKDYSVPVDMQGTLEALRDSSTGSLIKATRLSGVADELSSVDARREVHAFQRELLDAARDGAMQIGKTLDRLRMDALKNQPTSTADDPQTLRQELDQQMDLARRVDERMQELESQITPHRLHE